VATRAWGAGETVSFEVLGGWGTGVGVRRNGSFGGVPWMMGRAGFGTGGAFAGRGVGRAGGCAPSNGDPGAFGDSRRVLRPENETLFSVPTQIGTRSSSVIWGDRMM
jgi:hypothetical protein